MGRTPTPYSRSRRRFLGQASCAALGSGSIFSSILNMAATNRAAAVSLPSNSDYRALVCLFLDGGNDSFNMLIPQETDEYTAYKETRVDLALDGSTPELTPLPITDQTGRNFGLHPSITELRDLYDADELAFIANAGTLVRPTTLTDYENQNFLPLGLFSHADQIQQWQTSVPNERTNRGWGGAAADLLHSLNADDRISMNISLSGNNLFQTGDQIVPYSITSVGSIPLFGYEKFSSDLGIARTTAITNALDAEYANLFKQTYLDKFKVSLEAASIFETALENTAISTVFPDTDLGYELKMVARTIASNSQLGHKRQTFFVSLGGWDHHDEVLETQSAMLADVSQCVKAFRDAMVEIGLFDNVTLFQASDFGRTLTTNTKGSDHGWGGNYFVMGGGVDGGKIHGTYPNLADLSTLDTGRGRLIPSISVDEYSAELALWLGVQPSDLATVFPNIGEFYDTSSSSAPVGFML